MRLLNPEQKFSVWSKPFDGSGGGNHPLTQSELHLPWFQIGDDNHQSSDQFFRIISLFDSGKYLTGFVPSETNGQLQEFSGLGNFFSLNDTSNPQIDFDEIVKRALHLYMHHNSD